MSGCSEIDAVTLDRLARVLDYPGRISPFELRVTAEDAGASGCSGGLGEALHDLAVWLASAAPGVPEERYTQLFDLKPVCTLNLGYHLFGDTYARGAFLARLNHALSSTDIEHSHDLPDFLPTLLRYLGTLEDPEDRILLVHSVLVPALERIGQALTDSPGPWPAILRALPGWLAERIPAGEEPVLVPPVPQQESWRCSM